MNTFANKVIKYNDRLMSDLGLTKVQACGIWGNLGTETGGFKYLQEIKPVVPGSKGGYGWKQWTGPRRTQYMEFCKKNGFDPALDEANYQFLVWEGKNTEKSAILGLRKTTTLKAATETYMLRDLRPGVQHLDDRLIWAQKAWDALETAPVPVPQPKPETQAGIAALIAASVAFLSENWKLGVALLGAGAIAYLIIKAIILIKRNTNGKPL